MTAGLVIVGVALFLLGIPLAIGLGILAAFVAIFGRLPW